MIKSNNGVFFTIITPTYNRAPIIAKTIHSVLKQSFVHFEYIIVDDGSKDNTEEVVKAFKDERIKYHYKENGERGAARNYGVSKSQGKYVFFLDSDDVLYSNHLEKAYEVIKRLNEPEFFFSRYAIVNDEGKEIGFGPMIKNPLRQVLKENPFACLVFLRKDIAQQFPFKEDRELQMLEDWLLWLQIASRFPLHFSNEPSCAIGMHDMRSMAIASAGKLIKAKDIMVNHLKEDSIFFKRHGEKLKRIEANLISLAALQQSFERDILGMKLLAKAVKIYPPIFFKNRTFTVFKNSLRSISKITK